MRARMPFVMATLRAARSASAASRVLRCLASVAVRRSNCFFSDSTLPTSRAVRPDERFTMSMRASMSVIEPAPSSTPIASGSPVR